MEAYSKFAQVYDIFMEDTPYDKWMTFIDECMQKYEIQPHTVCDLGCGTGELTQLYAKRGLEVIGIDSSEEMLMMAKEKTIENELDILYLMQDMSSFELGGTVDLIISTCDALNYILEEEDMVNTFKSVNHYLEPGGLFIFDINTPYKYKEILADHIFADQTEQAAYVWSNYYDEEEGINEYEVSFFIQDEEGRYERTIEEHYERAYTLKQMETFLKEAGMELLGIYDDYTFNPANSQTIRATFVAREKNKRKEP